MHRKNRWKRKAFSSNSVIFLVIFLIILVVILLVVFHVIKKNKGIVVVDDKAVFAEKCIDVKQHIILEQQKSGQPISLYLYSNGKMIKKVDAGAGKHYHWTFGSV